MTGACHSDRASARKRRGISLANLIAKKVKTKERDPSSKACFLIRDDRGKILKSQLSSGLEVKLLRIQEHVIPNGSGHNKRKRIDGRAKSRLCEVKVARSKPANYRRQSFHEDCSMSFRRSFHEEATRNLTSKSHSQESKDDKKEIPPRKLAFSFGMTGVWRSSSPNSPRDAGACHSERTQ